MNGQRPMVVLTRADADNQRLAETLSDHGLGSLSVPMIEVCTPADHGNALMAALANLDLYHWLVVTSANGVRAVASALEQVGGVEWPSHLQLAVVGPATEAAAVEQGWSVSFMPTTATSATLIDQFPAPSADSAGGRHRVLAALAELAGPTLARGLRVRGYQVDHVVAYRTSAPTADDAALRDQVTGADAIAFTSPSTVDRFVARFGHTAVPPTVVCIGPRTAERAEELSIAVTEVANPHTETGVVDALVHWLDDRRP